MNETKKRILIIDDDPDIVFTINEICEYSGYQTASANRGDVGYELSKTFKPHIVIVDYHMPGWDGLKTVKHIANLRQNMAILVLTVDERQEVSEKFMEAGATDFAIKPIKAPDLMARIKVNLHIQSMQEELESKKETVYLEKGISSATLNLITTYLQEQTDPIQMDEITKNVNLAYQTVHRYLQYLVEQEQVEVIPVYGQLGRPKNQYLWTKKAP